ncbi:flagellar biosynthesis protein FliH [Sphingomonas spermidinifaciens]|uniref:Flagellar biosynthesis protein FliH n=1 Tax=Sphingomonas spermidinifaciens TaxID=1141889 RepID=A0A2A4B8D8_9SPHN|nr:flagellar biosynthesis protein FliH [Sphingomonas spermidinifaciens]PCD04049.1 flagellar biosynthesis protein FliH [Sphingomonas spermidinifaciens]
MSEAFADTGRFAAADFPFAAGFAGRHADIGEALRRAFSPPPGFAPTPPGRPAEPEPAPATEGPRHFHPAERESAPASNWDPFAATVDPIAAARAEGYAEGLRAAADEAAVERARDMALMDQLARAVTSAAWLDRDGFARRLRQTVLALIGNLVEESGIDGERLAARIAAATDLLADAAEAAMLRLNPADMVLVEGRLPKTIFAVGDAAIARGAFSLEAASTIVEDGPARWLEQLATAIDQVPLPKC